MSFDPILTWSHAVHQPIAPQYGEHDVDDVARAVREATRTNRPRPFAALRVERVRRVAARPARSQRRAADASFTVGLP